MLKEELLYAAPEIMSRLIIKFQKKELGLIDNNSSK
jgi:hypothetical protein